jgi:hypothetical protein
MPYDNVPADKTAAMDSCVQQVQAEQGVSKERAIAICYASIVEGVEMDKAQRQQHAFEATISPRPNAEGKEWEVTIIGPDNGLAMVHGREYVKSKNGRLYSCAGLEKSVPMWEGVRVFDNHLTDEEFEERQGMRSVAQEWLGSIVSPRWDAQEHALNGTFKVVEDATARKLLNAHNQGILSTIGLSMDTIPQGQNNVIFEGERYTVIEGFEKIFSVDLVAEPAAGGGFGRLIAATQTMEADMPVTLEQLEARIAKLEALASGGQEQVDAAPEEVAAEIEQAVADVADSAPPEADAGEVAQAIANEVQAVADEIAGEAPPEEPMPEAIRKLETRLTLNEVLSASKLPADAQALVRAAFNGRTAEAEEVKRMVEQVRKTIAARDSSGRVTGAGGRAPITAGMAPEDWREVEFMRLMAGNMKFRALESVEDETVKERLTESRGYQAWVKNGRPRGNTRRFSEWLIQGFGDPLERAFEAATTSSLSSIVKNAVNILLASDFQARHQWWSAICREEEVDTIDTPTLIRWFGLGTLDVVDEGQAYTELALVDEEETAAFVKRGNYIGITMETLLRDKVNKIRAIPEMLADSWYNTLSKYAAAVFTTNSGEGPLLVGSAGNLFNSTAETTEAGHANLLTSPLSYSSYVAGRSAMMKHTNADVGLGVRLLIRPKYMLVPVELEATARQIIESPNKPGGADNDVNPYQNEVEIIVVPEWTDANNWALVADPQQYPAIWNLYYRGRRVPELYTSEDETQGAMFTNDTLRYKVRQLTFRYSSTYDCFPVSDFRPLQKFNVG